MKQIRKLLALVLACMTLVLALPPTALAANRGEPAGYVSQVNSTFTMPKPGQALPTTATNYVADTIVTATREPSGNRASRSGCISSSCRSTDLAMLTAAALS